MLESEIKNLKNMGHEERLKLLHSQATEQLRDVAKALKIPAGGDRVTLIDTIYKIVSNEIAYDKLSGRQRR